ncbi:MAG: hypothetical protein OEY61_14160 [Gammaproteobacteria bacterium]|nr:hypothetical protein [Gammaproteobacteria bacterium]
MKFFLTGKSWQIFLVLISPMLLLPVILVNLQSMQWFGYLWLMTMVLFIGWLYSIGSFANNNAPDNLRKNPRLYKVGFLIPLIYGVLLNIYFFPELELGKNTKPPFWLIPLHLLSMLGIFYGLLFTAKRLVTLQRSEKIGFFEYSGAFFLFWFFPIGIWFLQPKVNQLYNEKSA